MENLEQRVAALEKALADDSAQAQDPTGFLAGSWPLLGGLLLVGIVVWQRRERQEA
jgi:hypothetical protein